MDVKSKLGWFFLFAVVGVVGCTRANSNATSRQNVGAVTQGLGGSPRVSVTQRGDFVVIGNTLAQDCGNGYPSNVTVGTMNLATCDISSNPDDDAADMFWSTTNGLSGNTATSNKDVAIASLSSTAMLELPVDATVTSAWIYWSASQPSGVRSTHMTLEHTASASSQDVTEAFVNTIVYTEATSANDYASGADVTSFVSTHGAGAYRASLVPSGEVNNHDDNTLYAGWALVVFYKSSSPSVPVRSISLSDGFDLLNSRSGNASNRQTTGDFPSITIPSSGAAGKVGVIAFEGDATWTGDTFQFGLASSSYNVLEEATGIGANNFFDGSHYVSGAAQTLTGDLPQTTGTAKSLTGLDLDVVDVSQYLAPGLQTPRWKAAVEQYTGLMGSTVGDTLLIGATVGAFDLGSPDLATSTISVVNTTPSRTPGVVLAGDTLQFTVTAKNTGNLDSPNVNGAVATVNTPSSPVVLSPSSFNLGIGTVAAAGQSALTQNVTVAASTDGSSVVPTLTLTDDYGSTSVIVGSAIVVDSCDPGVGCSTPGEACNSGSGHPYTCVTGCNTDSECGSGWCNKPTPGASNGFCTPKIANATGLPNSLTCVTTQPSPNDSQNVGERACLSGSCDPMDNKCGLLSGTPGCGTSNDKCRSNQCTNDVCVGCTSQAQCPASAPICDNNSHLCVSCSTNSDCGGATPQCYQNQCVSCSSVSAACSGNTPICVTSGNLAGTCSGCNADYDTFDPINTLRCLSSSAPFCVGTGASAGSCSTCDAAGGSSACANSSGGVIHRGTMCATSGPIRGQCYTACTQDSNCASVQMCVSQVCQSKANNGQSVPNVEPSARNPSDTPLNGICTSATGLAGCISTVCSAVDNICGYRNGDVCNSAVDCRSGICVADSPSGNTKYCGLPNGAACSESEGCRSGVCSGGVCQPCVSDSSCGSTTSARVCSNDVCTDGCRGTGGNTCPSGQICSSTSNAIGQCSTNPYFTFGSLGGGGMDCAAAPGVHASRPWAILLTLIGVMAAAYRRRKTLRIGK